MHNKRPCIHAYYVLMPTIVIPAIFCMISKNENSFAIYMIQGALTLEKKCPHKSAALIQLDHWFSSV